MVDNTNQTLRDIIIKNDSYRPFRVAFISHNLPLFEYLINLNYYPKEDVPRAENYRLFRAGAVDVASMKYLEALLPEPVRNHKLEMYEIIQANYYEILNKAINKKNQPFINYLFNSPMALAHAESNENEPKYREVVRPFIDNAITKLRNEKAALERAEPNAVFNINGPERAKCCYFYLRNLIRRNDPNARNDILMLLDIPAVKALVAVGVMSGYLNELLRLALSNSNEEVVRLLLAIPDVRRLAAQENYYRAEQRGQLNLAQLAQDRESSMHALTTGEQKRLELASKLYDPTIKQVGVTSLMDELRATLADRYAKNPAFIMRKSQDGKEERLNLPLKREDFDKLTLTAAEKKDALKAYYKHKDHTALRYLSKPNAWMHARAAYVCVNPANTKEKWSTFEEYQPLIVLLYLAAKDEKTPALDGFTLESRLEHFIAELALIGRAHNWDKSRIKKGAKGDVSEEYDDEEGDRPSCFSGVKRRLFQSVVGHPAFLLLTKDIVTLELRDFVRAHFKAAIGKGDAQQIKQDMEEYIVSLTLTPALKSLDISLEEQKEFIAKLTLKYGQQFDGDKEFIEFINKAFALGPKDAHAITFNHLSWTQLLEVEGNSVAVDPVVNIPQVYLDILEPLKNKSSELVDYPEAQREMNGVIISLESAARKFYGAGSQADVTQFYAECTAVLTLKPDSKLTEHRLTLGAVFAAINHFFTALKEALSGKPLTAVRFFDSRTASEKCIEKAREDLEPMNPKIKG